MTLGDNSTIDVGGIRLSLSGVISDGGANGRFGLTKLSSGELVLNGANTYSGATMVSAGSLTLSGQGTLSGFDASCSQWDCNFYSWKYKYV